MNKERRTNQRLLLNLPARYDGLSGAHEARLEDISMGGCFVNARGQVEPGEAITIEIKMTSGEWLQLHGEVTSCQLGIGFGVVFSVLTEEDIKSLEHVLTSQS
jgi:hypothetical protein